jgi:hypothetical protein
VRSTTCISLILALASPATAGGPPPGCYDRSYTPEHLRKAPDQFVARIRLWLEPNGDGSNVQGNLSIWTANQGHARRDGLGNQQFDSPLICWSEGGQDFCGIECDGGYGRITVKGGTLDLRTDRMWIGEVEDCGGAIDLAERPDTPVTYRLTRVADAVCTD